MKIGFVIDDSIDSNDGVQQYVRTLGKWLTQQGHQVQYLAGQSQSAPNVHSLARNVGVRFNGNRFTIPLPASSKKIQLLLEQEHYDVLHVQMPYSPAMAGKIIKRVPEFTAVVGTFHILPYGRFQSAGNQLLGRLQHQSLKRFNEVCFVSSAAQEFAKKTYHITGVIIPNMIDVAAWKSKKNIKPGRLVFLGRLVPRKGCKQLLLALSALPAAMQQNLEIIIAGDGPERTMLERLAEKLGLKPQFYGYVTEQAKRELLASAEIAIFPSLGGESFGIVLLEAMAAGSDIVIAGENPGYRSVLGTVPGSLIDFKNTFTAAKLVANFIKDKNARSVLHQVQQRHITNYDIHTVGAKVEQMYITAIAKQAADRDNRSYAYTKKT